MPAAQAQKDAEAGSSLSAVAQASAAGYQRQKLSRGNSFQPSRAYGRAPAKARTQDAPATLELNSGWPVHFSAESILGQFMECTRPISRLAYSSQKRLTKIPEACPCGVMLRLTNRSPAGSPPRAA